MDLATLLSQAIFPLEGRTRMGNVPYGEEIPPPGYPLEGRTRMGNIPYGEEMPGYPLEGRTRMNFPYGGR